MTPPALPRPRGMCHKASKSANFFPQGGSPPPFPER
jgi:hypothetical protein